MFFSLQFTRTRPRPTNHNGSRAFDSGRNSILRSLHLHELPQRVLAGRNRLDEKVMFEQLIGSRTHLRIQSCHELNQIEILFGVSDIPINRSFLTLTSVRRQDQQPRVIRLGQLLRTLQLGALGDNLIERLRSAHVPIRWLSLRHLNRRYTQRPHVYSK